MPARRFGTRWLLELSTAEPELEAGSRSFGAREEVRAPGPLDRRAAPGLSELRATYRLQLTPEFGFAEARAVVPYLRDLGVSHLYLSPVMQARSGSTHGYDVVDPTRVSQELGGEDALRALCSCGLDVILDVVPNHMAASDENPYWRDPDRRRTFFDWDEETGWYRRFFTIDDLAGVRVEDPRVFAATHAKVFELVEEGLVQGLRIDHPDGLADPRGYLERLPRVPVWVEKIVEPGEQLRDWPVEGTTGYEFANDVTALFVDPAGEEPLTALYAELTGETRSFAAGGGRGEARARAHRLPARVRAAPRACSTIRGWRRRRPPFRSTAPTSSRGRGGSRTPIARRWPQSLRSFGGSCCSRSAAIRSSSSASSRRPGR